MVKTNTNTNTNIVRMNDKQNRRKGAMKSEIQTGESPSDRA
ncbi:MAG: hypothetical protein ACRC10_09440 [Thermoguttaceae bacterium]